MMHGCTPYGYDEEDSRPIDWDEYEEWLAEKGDREEDAGD